MTDAEKKETKKKAAPKKVDAVEKAPKKAPAKKTEAEPKVAAAKDKPAKAKSQNAVKKQGKLVDDIRLYDVLDRPLITEKSTIAAEQNKATFIIRPDVTKQQVKQAVEALFQVKVTKVNTILLKGKTKRFRGKPGQRSDIRKAIVTLAAGQTIDLAGGLK